MSWEAPAALWLGLAVPAVVLLWLLRPRRPRQRVPSLLLWPGSPAERQSARPWQRLRHHPLLWLQVAVAALLALAAARPYLPAEGASRHLIVLLDASGSMRARDVAPDRFGAARAAVLDLARALGPDQAMTVIRVDREPRVLVAEARSAGPVEAALAGEAAAYGPADAAAALALAAALTQGPAEWIVVGDGGLAVPEDFQRPPGTRYRFLAVGGPAANVAVSGLALRQEGDRVTVQAGLRSMGAAPVAGRLQLLAEDELVGVQEWRLGPAGETYLTWSALPAGAHWYEARLVGVPAAANALETDDRAWAAVSGADATRVLLVSPGNTFLERALSVHAGVRAFRAAPADWPGLAGAETAYPLTVLDRFWPERLPRGSALLVGPPVGEEFRPQEIWPRADHPLLRYADWSEVRVAVAHRLPLDATWETVVDSDGGPLLAVRAEGQRRQAVLAFDLAQSDLPLRPAFPILLASLLDWLAPRDAGAVQAVAPGAAVAVEPAPLAEVAWVEGADGARAELAPPWPPRPFQPPAPGLYRVIQAGEGMRQERVLVAGGYDPREADLAPRALDLPAAAGEPLPAAGGALAYWPWLALGVVLVSLAEWWVDARGR
ncbi:MAG TPA: BatA and WFA domain-containing protein [Chloroflexota bacterium]|nr:BatA and WFA domain-containing protein [Chloroflexota bacterium]